MEDGGRGRVLGLSGSRQGCVMAGRGRVGVVEGGELSNLLFVYEVFPPPPAAIEAEQCGCGSDLFYDPFKEERRGGGEEPGVGLWVPVTGNSGSPSPL